MGVSGLGGLTTGMTVSVSGTAHGEGTILATMVEASSGSGGGGGGGDATPIPTHQAG
jgi:hypothetical protein